MLIPAFVLGEKIVPLAPQHFLEKDVPCTAFGVVLGPSDPARLGKA